MKPVAGIDLAFARDSAALVIGQRDADIRRVMDVREVLGHVATDPRVVCQEFGALMHKAGVEQCCADVHYRQLLAAELAEFGIEVVPAPTQPWIPWLHFRRIAPKGMVAIPRGYTKLVKQLRAVKSKPIPGGLQIVHGRGKGGHGDIAAALCNMLWLLRDDAPDTSSFARVRARSAAFTGEDEARADRMRDLPDHSGDGMGSDIFGEVKLRPSRLGKLPNRWGKPRNRW